MGKRVSANIEVDVLSGVVVNLCLTQDGDTVVKFVQ